MPCAEGTMAELTVKDAEPTVGERRGNHPSAQRMPPNATIIGLSASVRTVERGFFGARSQIFHVLNVAHLATLLGIESQFPGSACASEACDRCNWQL